MKVKLDTDGDPYDRQADIWYKATGIITPEEHQAIVAVMSPDEESSSNETIGVEQLWELSEEKADEVLHLKAR